MAILLTGLLTVSMLAGCGGSGSSAESQAPAEKDTSGAPKALGFCYESFGIIVNKKLLEQAGHSLDEIKDFDSLKAVEDDIHARAGEMGFDVFSAPLPGA